MNLLELMRTTVARIRSSGPPMGEPEPAERPVAFALGNESNELNEVTGEGVAVCPPAPLAGADESNEENTPVDFVPSATDYTLVTAPVGLAGVVAAVRAAGGSVGLDCETTGLDPTQDRVRLLQIATPARAFVIDLFALPDPTTDLTDLFAALADVEVAGHNLQFDVQFLARLGHVPGKLFDTMLASQVLHAGRGDENGGRLSHRLIDVVRRELGVDLDKTEQESDWSEDELTAQQIRYAAADAAVLLPLAADLRAKLEAAGLTATAELEMRCLPGVARAASAGVGFDAVAWEAQAAAAEADRMRLEGELGGMDAEDGDRNWDSPAQVRDALAAAGVAVSSTADEVLAGIDHPLAARIREYRRASKRVSAYGPDWALKHVGPDGRVRPNWHQLGAATGRMSCSDPNLQQVPKTSACRRPFIAKPGRVLVKADYSQVEVRIAAKLAGEDRMLAAYRVGEDLHTLTAAMILGKPAAEVTKSDRQLAKAVNFGLLYGQGAEGLQRYARQSYGVEMTLDDARRYREVFFRSYPGLRRWHQRAGGNRAIDTRTLGGRRRVGVERFTEKLNTPVQGTGADGLKAAVALLWERRGDCPSSVPVLFAHDEIVVECDEGDAETAMAWLRACMVDGMAPLIDPVPVVVDVTVGRTWAGE